MIANVSSQEPREGLPPCIRMVAIFEDLQACWHDMDRCPVPTPTIKRHVITAGLRGQKLTAEDDCTAGKVRCTRAFVIIGTDDEPEAISAWNTAQDWLEKEVQVRG